MRSGPRIAEAIAKVSYELPMNGDFPYIVTLVYWREFILVVDFLKRLILYGYDM